MEEGPKSARGEGDVELKRSRVDGGRWKVSVWLAPIKEKGVVELRRGRPS